MALVLRYIERTKTGTFQYRRRVPKALAGIITKREFKKKLGDSEREALKAWPGVHAGFEREIDAAHARIATGQSAARPSATEREAYAEALRYRADLIEAGTTNDELSLTGDLLAESYPLNARSEPVGVSTLDRHMINVLRLGPERYKAPEPTLKDALKLYIKERAENVLDGRPAAFARRVVTAAITTLGRNPVVTSLTREDARKVRDAMLERVKDTGNREKISPATASRELTILSAVVSLAKVEFDLPSSFSNPFQNLTIPRAAKGLRVRDSEKRDPLPPKVLAATRERITSRAKPSLGLIWRMLEGTGCRLAEVSGLQ